MKLPEIYMKTTGDGLLQLTRPFIFYSIYIDEPICAPLDFIWDGSSVPFLLRGFVPKWYKTLRASCCHDYLLSKAKTKKEFKIADKVYKEILSCNNNKFVTIVGFMGVRIGSFFRRVKNAETKTE